MGNKASPGEPRLPGKPGLGQGTMEAWGLCRPRLEKGEIMAFEERIICSVRESPRARFVRLCLSMDGKLTVVIPVGFRRDMIPGLLQTKKGWFLKNISRIRQGQKIVSQKKWERPRRFDFEALGERWDIAYEEGTDRGCCLLEEQGQIRLRIGSAATEGDAALLLRKWLAERSRGFLEKRLATLSFRQEMPYNRLSVRFQKTRWGSCSSKKNINLNAKLAFLPQDLVDYVLCHELCHTVHLDHSAAFWGLLEQHLPGYRARKNAMKTAGNRIPAWVDSFTRAGRNDDKEKLTVNLHIV